MWFKTWALVDFIDAKRPEISPFKFSGTLSTGKRASVTCAVIDGNPPFVFEWYKDNVPLKSSSSILIKTVDEFTSTLAIVNLGPENNGNYTCRVSNVDGTDQQWDALFMKGINYRFSFYVHLHGNYLEYKNFMHLFYLKFLNPCICTFLPVLICFNI